MQIRAMSPFLDIFLPAHCKFFYPLALDLILLPKFLETNSFYKSNTNWILGTILLKRYGDYEKIFFFR